MYLSSKLFHTCTPWHCPGASAGEYCEDGFPEAIPCFSEETASCLAVTR